MATSTIPAIIKTWVTDVGEVTLSTTGTDVTIGYPTGFSSSTNRIIAVLLLRAWPKQNWNNGAVVTIASLSAYLGGDGIIQLTTTSGQKYDLVVEVIYI